MGDGLRYIMGMAGWLLLKHFVGRSHGYHVVSTLTGVLSRSW
jgi:hypothetical protein